MSISPYTSSAGPQGIRGFQGFKGDQGFDAANSIRFNQGETNIPGGFGFGTHIMDTGGYTLIINYISADGIDVTSWVNSITLGDVIQVTDVSSPSISLICKVVPTTTHPNGIVYYNNQPTGQMKNMFFIEVISGSQNMFLFNNIAVIGTSMSGIQGSQGFQGNQGLLGNQGLPGFQGNQGLLGNQGLQGFQGNQGFQGPRGGRGAFLFTPVFNGGTVYGENSNTFHKESGNDNIFDAEVYSTQGFARGCYVSAQPQSTLNYVLFGLSENPAGSPSYPGINFAWYVAEQGSLEIYESGVRHGGLGAYTTDTILEITYDGYNIRYWKDGILQRTVARAIGNPLYFDSTFFRTISYTGGVPNGLKNVVFGPMGASGAQGFQGRQGSAGTNGSNGATGAQGFQGNVGNTGATGATGSAGATGGFTTNSNAQVNSLGVGTSASGTAGTIRATNDIVAYYSDKRLKSNIKLIENALEKVCKISGISYTQSKLAEDFGYNNYEQQVGVIAQEIQEVLPEAVKPAPFDMDENGNSKSGENYITVQYEKIVPLLIEAIKELKNEIDLLKR